MENPISEHRGPVEKITRFFRTPVVLYTLSGMMVLGVVLVISPPKALVFKIGVDYAVRFMLAYLLIGFFFLLVGQNRLLFISFLCCATLAFYLKNRTDAAFTSEPRVDASAPTIRLTHFSVDNLGEQPAEELARIIETDPDIISVQEVSPIFDSLLHANLSGDFPYSYSIPDVNLFGQALYSKTPFTKIDTFHFEGIPVLFGRLLLENQVPIVLAGVHTYPALTQSDYDRLQMQLDLLATQLLKEDVPMLVFGDFQVVPWSNEVMLFREQLNLRDSRRGLLSAYPQGSFSLLDIPFDHIFHSPEISCIEFATINSEATTHLGITGAYQVKYHPEPRKDAQNPD
jgi:endonuclease/exonuclease/phosphatase (EEP) superfamily protein YafD